MKLEELFEEMDVHLQKDDRPSEYLEKAGESELFLHFPFEMLHRMKKTKQSPKYHPEGNVFHRIASIFTRIWNMITSLFHK